MAHPNISIVEKEISNFPIEARIHTRNVYALGMAVFLETVDERQFLCWEGSDEKFAKSNVFKAGLDFSKVKRKKWFCPWGLRGYLVRLENGNLKFMIAWCYLPSRPISYMRAVRIDDAFNRFKERCLHPAQNTLTEADTD